MIGVEHVDHLLGLLRSRALIPPRLGTPDAATVLRRAAAELVEQQRRSSLVALSLDGSLPPPLDASIDSARDGASARGTIDVWELLLYWMELWGSWDPRASLQTRAMPRPQRRRVGEVGSRASMGGGAANVGGGMGTEADGPADVQGSGEEDFAAAMRQNAMEFDAADKDRDKKLDFKEFSAMVREREEGIHSEYSLHARFNALDRDGSGKIELHEFIRFSLRDALARARTRVMDLLREWDEDKSGEIDKKEFRLAIQALGFGVLADRHDIDMIFDLFDLDGSGAISYKEMNKMLRQRADQMIGGAEGKKAAAAEASAQLKRGNKAAAPALSIKIDRNSSKSVQEQLREALGANSANVMQLFREWDESGDGLLSKREFQHAMFAMGFDNVSNKEWRALFDSFDRDRSGTIEYDELLACIERT